MSTTLGYAEKNIGPKSVSAMIFLWVAVGIDLAAAILLVAANFQSLWSLPPGSSIRPMGLAALDFEIGGAALLASLVPSLVALRLGWHRKHIWILSLLLICLGFAPFFLSQVASIWIINTHRLILEP